jgi:hypothetical protein
MKGVIVHINESRGMVAVATEAGDFSIFELTGGDSVAIDDVVRWNGDTPLGGATLVNDTQGERFEVYFQNHHVSRHQLRQQLLYP